MFLLFIPRPLGRLGLVSVLRESFGTDSVRIADDFEGLVRPVSDRAVLALVDRDLPGLASLDQIRHLRLDHPGTKFVLVSRVCSLEFVFDAVRCGAHGFVPKTLGSLEMAEAFRHVMAGLIYVPCQVRELPDLRASKSSDPVRVTCDLSSRQRQVVRLVCEGLSNKEIARQLAISEATVKLHFGTAFRALGVTSRARVISAFHRHNPAPAAPGILHHDPTLVAEGQAA